MTEATTSQGETIDTDDSELRSATARGLGDHVLATLDLPGMPQYVSGHSVLALEQLAAAGSPGAMRALCQLVDLLQPYAQLWDAGLWTHPDLMGVTPTAPPPAPPTPAAARPGRWARFTRTVGTVWGLYSAIYGWGWLLFWALGVPAAAAAFAYWWWTR